VPDVASSFGDGDALSGEVGSLRDVQDVIARTQRLIDTPRPANGYPLAWQIEALHVGDLPTIAMAALRSPRSS
jgi:hypothetical protein